MDFPIFPWDRKRPHLHPPQAQNTLDWQGTLYGLRAMNGLLFLLAAGQPKTLAVATPLSGQQENNAESFPAIARGALRRGDVARFVVVYDHYLERTLPLFLRADGTGFCRESWNRDDLPFEHEVSMHEWMEGDDAALAAREPLIGRDSLHAQLSALSDHYRRDLEWICGSLEALTQLATWICHLETQIWRDCQSVSVEVRGENEFGRAGVSGLEFDDNYSNTWDAMLDEESDQWEVWSQGEIAPTKRFLQLFDVALDENTPTSLDWEYHDYGAGRCANAPQSESLEIKVWVPDAAQIEAASQNLRAWLQGKMTAREIEATLNDDAPTDLPEHE